MSSFERIVSVEPFESECWTDYYKLFDHIYLPSMQIETQYGQVILVKTDFIHHFIETFVFKTPIYIVTAISDYSPSLFFQDETLKSLLDNPYILGWGMEHCIIDHPKVYKIHPIIGTSGDSEEDKIRRKFIRDNMERFKNKQKKDQVFAYNTIEYNPEERGELSNLFDVSDVCKSSLTFEEYFEEMSNYKYVLCAMSNGIGVRKFFEAVVCGCIPIVRVPKEYLDTYDRYPYICLPGTCYVRLGLGSTGMRKMKSIFKTNKLEITR